jgi:hypothetical protein
MLFVSLFVGLQDASPAGLVTRRSAFELNSVFDPVYFLVVGQDRHQLAQLILSALNDRASAVAYDGVIKGGPIDVFAQFDTSLMVAEVLNRYPSFHLISFLVC